jgi:hypothetical protein
MWYNGELWFLLGCWRKLSWKLHQREVGLRLIVGLYHFYVPNYSLFVKYKNKNKNKYWMSLTWNQNFPSCKMSKKNQITIYTFVLSLFSPLNYSPSMLNKHLQCICIQTVSPMFFFRAFIEATNFSKHDTNRFTSSIDNVKFNRFASLKK